MNKIITLATAAVATVTLAGCMETSSMATDASAPTATTIQTEAEFRTAIVGKTLTFNGNSFSVNADGTLSGPWDGSGITGTWNWDNGAMCREARIGTRQLDPDCQTFAVEGSTATVTRDRGAGQSFDYTIS